MSRKPNNYSWLDDFIAGSAQPFELNEIEAYKEDGVTDMLSLTPEKPLITKFLGKSVNHHHFPIYSIPSPSQIEQFQELATSIKERGGKLVVHCQFGQERTGIMLAVYLVKIKGMAVEDAIELVQERRPGSLRTQASLQYLKQYFTEV